MTPTSSAATGLHRLHRQTTGLALALVITLTALCAPARAAVELKGAHFDDSYQLGNQSLSLNGAGIRVKLIIDVYAAGLYVPHKGHDAAALLGQSGPKSLQIVLLRDLTGEDFAEAMMKGFSKTNSAADQARFQPKLDTIRKQMIDMGKVRKGTVIHIDFMPGSGTIVTLDGVRRGPEITGDDFFPALMHIWLGANPVDSDLKDALLDVH